MTPQPLLELFAIEPLWTETQRMVRDSVRAFSREVYAPRVRDAWRKERFPDELVPQIGALGVLGAQLHGYGCAGSRTGRHCSRQRCHGCQACRPKGPATLTNK